MADPDDLYQRVAVLETQQKSTFRDIGSIEENGSKMQEELQGVQKDVTKILTTARNITWLLGVGIPVAPLLGAFFHKLIGV